MGRRHLKVTGDLGRVVFNEWDIRNTQSIEESVRHSNIVYNLVGSDYATKNFSLEDVHVEATERIAEAVAKYDVDRFVQVSSYNADKNSPSEFFRTKARGEEIARQIYPETTIVRPAPIFGFEDRLLHVLASNNRMLTANNLQQFLWPVHAVDVGEALEKMAQQDWTAGQTFELYGPKEYQMVEIADLVDREIFKERRRINLPKQVLKPVADVLNKVLWWHTMTGDEIDREFIDQTIDPTAKTFADLNIEPADVASLTFHYLVRVPTHDIGSTNGMCSKLTAAPRTTICRLLQKERRGKRRSTSTSSTINERFSTKSADSQALQCTSLYILSEFVLSKSRLVRACLRLDIREAKPGWHQQNRPALSYSTSRGCS